MAHLQNHNRAAVGFGTLLGCTALLLTVTGCAYAKLEMGIVAGRAVSSGELSGVTVERPEKGQVTAKAGMELKKGDVIQTDTDTYVVVTFRSDKTRVVAYPDSKFRIGSVIMDWGRVLYESFVEDVEVKVAAPAVEDGRSILGREGTAFDYQVTKHEETTCTVLNGRAQMRASDGSWGPKLVRPFERLRIVGNQPDETVQLTESERDALIEEFNRVGNLTGNKTAIVPRCIGLNVQTAEGRLRDAGLSPKRSKMLTEDPSQIDQVLEQDPTAGAQLKLRKAVQLRVGVKAVPVPNVVGSQRSDAEARLRQRSLRTSVRMEITGRQPRDTVLRQHPSSGTLVEEQSVVSLTVEAPSEEVPPLVGLDRALARRNLGALGLRYRERGTKITGQQEEGHVIEQKPRPGTRVPPNSEVSVVLEAPSVLIPNVVGMPLRSARATLGRSGALRVSEQREFAPRRPAGSVIRQQPRAGKRVPPGTRVTIVIAEPGVEVPNLSRHSIRSAERVLASRGLKINQYPRESNARRGQIVDQVPRAGTRVARDTVVKVWFAQRSRDPEKPQKVRVPNLVRLFVQDAQKS